MSVPGLHVYLDSHDMAHMNATIITLRRCGAVGALVLTQSVDGRKQDEGAVRYACDSLRAFDLDPTLYGFPPVDGNHTKELDHYLACRKATGAPGQLDAEPHGDHHWTAALAQRWRTADPSMSITSTRAEAPHLGLLDCPFWLQGEAQTSWKHLPETLKRYPAAIVVTGVFDTKGDPRTIVEIKRDLHVSQPQARKTGFHGAWCAHTMTPEKADAHREWVVETWGPPSGTIAP